MFGKKNNGESSKEECPTCGHIFSRTESRYGGRCTGCHDKKILEEAKRQGNVDFNTEVTDEEALREIKNIAERLDEGEKVLEVAKQSRIKPGGAIIAGGNTVFATDRRLIIRNPTMLGARQNIEDFEYYNITGIKLEKGLFSATLVITVPGMGSAARTGKMAGLLPWGRGEDGIIDGIPKDKAEKILKIVRHGIVEAKKESQKPVQVVQQISTADELAKLAKLKEQGILSDEECDKMKKDLISKM